MMSCVAILRLGHFYGFGWEVNADNGRYGPSHRRLKHLPRPRCDPKCRLSAAQNVVEKFRFGFGIFRLLCSLQGTGCWLRAKRGHAPLSLASTACEFVTVFSQPNGIWGVIGSGLA